MEEKKDYFTEAKKEEQPIQSQPQQNKALEMLEITNRLSHVGIANLEKIALLQEILKEQKKSQDILIDFGKKLFAELKELKPKETKK